MTPLLASFLLQKIKTKEAVFMKLNCEFFYGYEADQFKFYRVPQILVTDKRFKNVSYGAKLLYGVLLDRTPV